MKKVKKISTILMISILLFMQLPLFIGSNVKAATIFPMNKADLVWKGQVVLCSYNGVGIIVEVTYYRDKNGKEYPAYCVNKGKPGVTEDHTYTLSVGELLSNNAIWRAVSNGYPYVSLEDLSNIEMYGKITETEAYVATKMALYHTYYGYDVSKFGYYTSSTSNSRVLYAIKKICKAADKAGVSKIGAVVNIKEENQEWKVDEKDPKYVSKTYSISASADFSKYNIEMSGENISHVQIVNVDNKCANETSSEDFSKGTFKKGEKFKVIIPITELENSGEFTLRATAELKTKPVFYGESPNSNWQNFALTGGSYELTDATLKQKFYENKTKIEILKQDGEKKTPLANGKFTLLDSNRDVVYTELTTDENGMCEMNYLLPGTYYLREIQAPSGYYGYDDDIEINIKLNEKAVITIDNFEKPTPVEEEKPQEENHVSVSQKHETITLPRTGF